MINKSRFKQRAITKNKKGQMSFAMKAMLTILIFLVLSIIFSRFLKGANNVVRCTSSGGTCVKDTCDIFTQVALLGDRAAGCGSEEKCCVTVDKTKPADSRCAKHAFGFECVTGMYCDAASQCTTKCDFCKKNYDSGDNNGIARTICKTTTGPTFATLVKNKDAKILSCSCTDATCKKDESLCIRNACSPTGDDICCISS